MFPFAAIYEVLIEMSLCCETPFDPRTKVKITKRWRVARRLLRVRWILAFAKRVENLSNRKMCAPWAVLPDLYVTGTSKTNRWNPDKENYHKFC